MTTYTYLTTYRYQPSVIRIIDKWVSPLAPYPPFAPLTTLSPVPTTAPEWNVYITPFKTAPTFEVWSQWRESENE